MINLIKILNDKKTWVELKDISPSSVVPLGSSGRHRSWTYGKNAVIWLPELDIDSAYYCCALHNMFSQIDIGEKEPAIVQYDDYGIIPNALKLIDVPVYLHDNTSVDLESMKLNRIQLQPAKDTQTDLFISLGCNIETVYTTACKRAYLVVETDSSIDINAIIYAAANSNYVLGTPFCYQIDKIYSGNEYSILSFVKVEV